MLNYQRVFPKTCQLLALCYPLLLRYAISQPGDVFIHLCATKLPRRSCASHTLRWNATSPKISFLAPNHFGKYGFPNFFPFQEPFGYGSIPINTIFRGMNVHLPAILMFTRTTEVLEIMNRWKRCSKRTFFLEEMADFGMHDYH